MSAAQVWSIQICTIASLTSISCANCSGRLIVRRLYGCPRRSPPSSSQLAQLLHAIGPDEFHVFFEGPEFVSLTQHHLGHCVYEFPFTSLRAGEYRLFVAAVRSDWDALNDTNQHVFPPLTLDNLVSPATRVTFGEAPSPSTVEQEIHECASHERMTDGRWQHTSSLALSGPLPYTFRSYPDGPGWQYYTNLRRDLVWVPRSCALPTTTALPACLHGRHILFHGDSHMRTLFNYILFTACGVMDSVTKGSDRVCFRNATAQCGNTTLCFEAEAKGGWHGKSFHGVDVLIANFGQHLATRKYLDTADSYVSRVSAYATRVASSLSWSHRRTRLVWIETYPPCVRIDDYVFAFADQRTTPRMRLFNALARSVLSPLTQQAPLFQYVSTFDMLTAVMDASSDNAHLTDFNAALLPLMHFSFRAACTGS